RTAGTKVREKLWKRLLRRTEKHGVGLRRRFVGQRRHVQSAQRDERAPGPVLVGEAVGTIGVRDVDLNQHQIGLIVKGERLHVLVDELQAVIRVEKRRQRGEAERRKQRVFDRPPIGAGGFGERR